MNEKIMEKITSRMDILYRFILFGTDTMFCKNDYGTGEVLNVVEIHTLTMIADNPGICISDVARLWNRTLGAASRNVDKLKSKGYVEKKKLNGNNKTIRLYPTEKGKELSLLHKEFDRNKIRKAAEKILQTHTPDEVEGFFSIMQDLTEIMKDFNL